MGRVIKFRGLRTDGKGWIYGWLFRDGLNGKMAIQQDTYETMIDTGHKVKSVKSREVIPYSVGQFTGLLDKNGKYIYEGDLLNSYHTELKYKVLYHDSMFSKELFCPNSDLVKAIGRSHLSQSCIDNVDFEIIGNIHEESEVTNG